MWIEQKRKPPGSSRKTDEIKILSSFNWVILSSYTESFVACSLHSAFSVVVMITIWTLDHRFNSNFSHKRTFVFVCSELVFHSRVLNLNAGTSRTESKCHD